MSEQALRIPQITKVHVSQLVSSYYTLEYGDIIDENVLASVRVYHPWYHMTQHKMAGMDLPDNPHCIHFCSYKK